MKMTKAEREERAVEAWERIGKELSGLVQCFAEILELAKKDHELNKTKAQKDGTTN